MGLRDSAEHNLRNDRPQPPEWLLAIGKTENAGCKYRVAHNAVYVLECKEIADGKGRKWEEIWQDQEWCRAVTVFLRSQMEKGTRWEIE